MTSSTSFSVWDRQRSFRRHKGELVAEIDPRDFEVAVASAEAGLQTARAAEPLDRYQKLANTDSGAMQNMQQSPQSDGAIARVAVRVDALGGQRIEGHIDSSQRGAGSAFALRPPETATGNLFKIALDGPADARNRASPGMSVEANVTGKRRSGWRHGSGRDLDSVRTRKCFA